MMANTLKKYLLPSNQNLHFGGFWRHAFVAPDYRTSNVKCCCFSTSSSNYLIHHSQYQFPCRKISPRIHSHFEFTSKLIQSRYHDYKTLEANPNIFNNLQILKQHLFKLDVLSQCNTSSYDIQTYWRDYSTTFHNMCSPQSSTHDTSSLMSNFLQKVSVDGFQEVSENKHDWRVVIGLCKIHYFVTYLQNQESASRGIKEANALLVWLKKNPQKDKYKGFTYLIYFMRALARLSLMDLKLCIDDFSTSISLYAHFPAAYMNRSLAYLCSYESGDKHALDLSQQDFDKCIELDSQHKDEYLMNKGLFMFETLKKNNQEAMNCLTESIKTNPKNAVALFHRGRLNFQVFQSYGDSIDDLEQAVDIDPTLSSAYSLLGYIYTELGDAQSALRCYDRLLEVESAPSSKIEALTRKAHIYAEFYEDADKSLECSRRALSIDPNNTRALYLLGSVMVTLKEKPDEALPYLNRSIELDSKNFEAYNMRGRLYWEHKNDIPKAMSDLNQSISLFPQNYLALTNRGCLFASQKKWEEALQDFSIALTIKASFAPALMNRASTYAQMGKLDHAERDYKRLVVLCPDDPIAYLERAKFYEDFKKDDYQAKKDRQKAQEIQEM